MFFEISALTASDRWAWVALRLGSQMSTFLFYFFIFIFCISGQQCELGVQCPAFTSPGLKVAVSDSANSPSDPSPGLLLLNREAKLATAGSVN